MPAIAQLPLWQVLVLAVVQGLTEFLPISSSGHLVVLAAWLSSGDGERLDVSDLNVVLHVGTLGSVCAFYGYRIVHLIREDHRMLGLLALGSVPTVLLGVPLKVFLEPVFSSATVTGLLLIATGGILIWGGRAARRGGIRGESGAPGESEQAASPEEGGKQPGGNKVRAASTERGGSAEQVGNAEQVGDAERFGNAEREASAVRVGGAESEASAGEEALTVWQALFIGAAQAVAVLPGLSRSGATISVALRLGLTPRSAATFSFLLAIPAIAGAGLWEAVALFSPGEVRTSAGALVAGLLVSFGVGWVALSWLVSWLERGRLSYFAWWCIPLGLVVLADQWWWW